MIPKIVGKMIGNDKYAITVGKTIYISCDIDTFLEDTDWVKHEMTHIIQYRKHGTVDFLVKYLRYSLHYSYRNNPFEKEAFSVEK